MDPKFLKPEEVRYECTIRGINWTDNVTRNRAALTHLLNCEVNGEAPPRVSLQYDQVKELEFCIGLVEEIRVELSRLGLSDEVFSRLSHLRDRFKRISQASISDCDLYEKTKAKIDQLASEVHGLPTNQAKASQKPSMVVQDFNNPLGAIGLNHPTNNESLNNTIINTASTPILPWRDINLPNNPKRYGAIPKVRKNIFPSEENGGTNRLLSQATGTNLGVEGLNRQVDLLGLDQRSPPMNQSNPMNENRTTTSPAQNNRSNQNIPPYNAFAHNQEQIFQMMLQMNQQILLLQSQLTNSNAASSQTQSVRQNLHNRHYNPVKHWDLQFSGKPGTISIHEFLSAVESFARTDRVSDEQLYEWGTYLFLDPAKTVYETARSSNRRTWAEVVNYMKDTFIVGDFQESIKSQIYKAQQEKQESVGLYFSRMRKMFRFCDPPVLENEKIRIMKRSIKSEISMYLVLQNVLTFEELEVVCRKIEKDLHEVNVRTKANEILQARYTESPYRFPQVNYVECNQPTGTVYNNPPGSFAEHVQNILGQPEANDELQSANQVETPYEVAVASSSYNRNRSSNKPRRQATPEDVCFNCDAKGHFFRECPQAKSVFCHSCGLKGFYFNTCISQRCQAKNGKAGLRCSGSQ